VILTLILVAWIGGNLVATQMGLRLRDAPLFAWLQGVVTIGALYMTVLILATQRHANEFSGHREQLILQLALLNEQKSAKTIRLLGELRRDNPMVENRDGREAAAMSTPADSDAMLDVIKGVQDSPSHGKHQATDRPSDQIPT